MNLAQFQIILQKINALDKNINMDGKISSIEKDLMKAYVSQLYEACVSGDSVDTPAQTPVVETKKVAPTPPVQAKVHEQIIPVQKEASPIPPQTVAAPANTAAPVAQVQPVAQVHVEQVVSPIEQHTQPIAQVTQVENTIKEVNERIVTPPKTVADTHTHTSEKGKSINERLAAMNKGKTFNDKFTDPLKSAATSSAPILINIPDSLKHMDKSNPQTTSPNITPPPAPTPPSPPTQQTISVPPIAKPQPVQTAAPSNVNNAFSLFDAASADAGKWGSTPIADLGKSIGLNDKISMIKELFSDDQHAFNNALTQLNSIGGFEQAKDYMMRNLITGYDWNQPKKLERAKQFINLVRRRFK